MRYFTPELLARYRSPADAVADAAAAEWEQAVAKYNAELDAIRSDLPGGVIALLDRYSLHDAKLLGVLVAAKRPRVSLLIQLEGRPNRPGKVLELRYLVARRPSLSVTTHGNARKALADGNRIQYDEFGKVSDDPAEVFSHSLLLKDGSELRITFVEMQVRRLQRLILPAVERLETLLA